MSIFSASPAPDAPRLLKDECERERRRQLLSAPHMAPLTIFADALRQRGFGDVPDFDPCDGGVRAAVLFLFEKPGPQAGASGFISRNNDDPTAENTFRFMHQAGLPRECVCIWNVVPGWNGTRAITGAELRRGVAAVRELLLVLPELRAIALVGNRAAKAQPLLMKTGLPIIRSRHPSPIVYATRRKDWESIPSQWARATEFV